MNLGTEALPVEVDTADITDDPRILSLAAIGLGLVSRAAEDAGCAIEDMDQIIAVMARVNTKVLALAKLLDTKGNA